MIVVADPADAKREAEQMLNQAAAAAWQAYRDTCRRAVDYDTVEPWAWKCLQERLQTIAKRRRRLQ